MGIQSNAHFGVSAESLDIVVAEVRAALQGFEAAQYGVSDLRVEHRNDASFVIKFEMASADTDQADADAERADEVIRSTLQSCFERHSVRERQREVTIA
ncbi:MAG: hypothetical protein E6R04_06270 [Spirochaetes bacterium]|nr:MAG: hypothetical protein E6R04_06270 [Spirochaetota bacterium]